MATNNPLQSSDGAAADGARARKQNGATCVKLPDAMEIYSAEMAPLDPCNKALLMMSCRKFDMERSYIYLREGSIESNFAMNCCIGGQAVDNVSVQYFDRAPLQAGNVCLGLCCYAEPKIEVNTIGCQICCIPIKLGEQVVVMPFEQVCGKKNRIGCCDNRCGLCGGISGAPRQFTPFVENSNPVCKLLSVLTCGVVNGAPRPANASAFCKKAQEMMAANKADMMKRV